MTQRRGAEFAEKALRKTEEAIRVTLLRSGELVICVLHGFAEVDVASAAHAEVENFAGFAIGRKPILAVDLFAIGYESGDEIPGLTSFD